MSDRYQRHGLIDWFDQKKVHEARIVVIGAGAVGNEVLKNLALLGVGHIHIIDFDLIEEHNLTRCVLFRDSDIGRYKGDVAAAACRKIDQNVEIKVSNQDFWDGLSLGALSNSDAVICCVDNFEARVRINKLCMLTATDLYNTAIDSRYVSVELYPFSTNSDCACYECTLPPSTYTNMQKRYSCGWLRKVAFEEKKIPTTAITSSIAGAVVVSILLNRLNDHPQAIQGAFKHFQDSITLESMLSEMQREDNCFACKSVDQDAKRIIAKRSCAIEPIIPLGVEANEEIIFSEPILSRGICKICGREQEHYESVRKLTDAVTFCSICGSYSNIVEYIERISLNDFKKYFGGRKLPCKYIIYNPGKQQIIIEMED